VSENRVLRIFGPKREEGAGGWRRLHNEELHNLYASPNRIRVIKSRKLRLWGHVAHMGGGRNQEGRNHFEDLGINERIIMGWILEK
jgi:hypothetical protein